MRSLFLIQRVCTESYRFLLARYHRTGLARVLRSTVPGRDTVPRGIVPVRRKCLRGWSGRMVADQRQIIQVS